LNWDIVSGYRDGGLQHGKELLVTNGNETVPLSDAIYRVISEREKRRAAETERRKYLELVEDFHRFRLGEISKSELACSIHMYQRGMGYEVPGTQQGGCPAEE